MLFIDANILIYTSLSRSPFHDRAKKAIAEADASGETLAISRQVLREFLSATTGARAGDPAAMSIAQARSDIKIFLQEFRVVEDGPAIWEAFEKLMTQFSFAGKQIHDAYLVATMLAHGIDHLLTHNTKDFERYTSRIILQAI